MNRHLVTLGTLLDDPKVKSILPLGMLAEGMNAITQLDAEVTELQDFKRSHENAQHEEKN